MLDGTREKAGVFWCSLMHDSPMWPIHGEYECRICGRRYPVAWGDAAVSAPAAVSPAARLSMTSSRRIRSVLVPAAVLLAIFWPRTLHGADRPSAESLAGASAAFARYITGLNSSDKWALEDVEIEATLPKLAKEGRLRAIRSTSSQGEAEYQVVDTGGDPTVRRQVIARYLSAEKTAAALPAGSAAITPANYEFRYHGAVSIDAQTAYVFQIKPRKKREGLIKGELWIDGETGAAIRISGYLVRTSSVFVKRLDVTRVVTLDHGKPVTRLTHLLVSTRLVGPAELMIREAPYRPGRGSTRNAEW